MSKTVAQAGRPKTRYRTRNWREYDRGLIARGDLTVWISPELVWHACEGTGRRGRPPVFTDAAIQCVLTLKVLFQLPLRAAQGMAGSLIRLAELGVGGVALQHPLTASKEPDGLDPLPSE